MFARETVVFCMDLVASLFLNNFKTDGGVRKNVFLVENSGEKELF